MTAIIQHLDFNTKTGALTIDGQLLDYYLPDAPITITLEPDAMPRMALTLFADKITISDTTPDPGTTTLWPDGTTNPPPPRWDEILEHANAQFDQAIADLTPRTQRITLRSFSGRTIAEYDQEITPNA